MTKREAAERMAKDNFAVSCSECPFDIRECKGITCTGFCKQWLADNPVDEPEATDMVNSPSHYTSGKIEVITFIEDQDLPYHLANAIKYICRCRYKGTEKQDIDKAIWYLNRWRDL